jgi:hypothetical protein
MPWSCYKTRRSFLQAGFVFEAAAITDAQSFSNSFEGVHGVVKKSGRGPLFLCFVAFLCYNFSKSFGGYMRCPPLCASLAAIKAA